MKLWRVQNLQAGCLDAEEMIILAETAQRALELFYQADSEHYAWKRYQMRVEEIVLPDAQEGVLLANGEGW